MDAGHCQFQNQNMLKLLLIMLSDIQQGSMASPTAILTDQSIDPNMSLDPKLLFPIEETIHSDPTQSTHSWQVQGY